MNCPNCEKKLRVKYITYDYSKKCGIPGTYIKNVRQFKCKDCDEVYTDLGDHQELNYQIVAVLLGADQLNRNHIKFIRTEIFDMTVGEFAKLIKTLPAHIKDLEAKKTSLIPEISRRIQTELFKKTQRPTIRLIL